MNIYSTPIITAEQDIFWSDASRVTKGAGPRPLLVLVNEYLPGSPEESQLKKMLEAPNTSNLKPEQYNVIGLKPGEKVAWHQLHQLLAPKIVMLIGILPAQLGISALFVLNSANSFDGCIWIPTVSLEVLGQKADLRGALWNNGMKPVLRENKYGYL